jgi:hypothetical protein
VTGLPIDKAENEIQSTLAEIIHNLLTEDEKNQAKVEITCIPSCDGIQTSSALVEFKGANPEFLSQLTHNPLGNWISTLTDTFLASPSYTPPLLVSWSLLSMISL